MEQQIQDLIDSIRKEGIETAKAESAKIVEDARKEAEEIVVSAEKKRDEILAKAESEAALKKSSGEATLKQAARDLSLSVKKSIEAMYSAILRDKVAEVMKGPELYSLIMAVLSGEVSGKAVELSKADADSLRSSVSEKFAALLKEGLEVRESTSLHAGFRIIEKDGSGYVDISDEECTKLLMPYLSSSMKEILG